MTKVLNSLRVTGTGSSSQALGVTGGYVNINGNLSVGTWNPSSGTNFYILSGSSSTNPMIIRNNSNSNDIFKVFDTGAVEINNSQTGTSLVTLTLGSTSSVNGVGVLQIGSTNSGLRIVGDNNFPSFLSSNGDFVFNNSLNTTLNYNSLWFDIGTGSSQIPMISTNTNSTRSLRLASGGGAFYLSTNIQSSGANYITTDRLIIPGGSLNSPFVNPRFVNTGTLQIENAGITTRNIGSTTSNSYPNTFIIGNSQSSINISGTTYGVPTSWSQGSIIIAPGNTINMTASHFPVSGLTHTNNSNILMVAQLSTIPTGNYNVMIGGGSKITAGYQNVGIGNAQYSTNPALGELTIGYQNVAVGSNAMGKLISGNFNTALGDRSLNSSNSNSFSNNVGVGIQAGQSVASSNNIFIGANAGRSYDGLSDSVLYLSTHVFSASARVEAAATHYSSTYATWSGSPPSWVSTGNIAIIGNESSGSRESSTINSTGTFRSLFFGKGMWHLSTYVNTYVISTSMPTLMTWTASGSITPNSDAPGSSLELIAGVGRGGGTAGDIYFSTGQLATSGTSSLQNKVTRMAIKGGSGFIGIGTQSPSTFLHIYSTQSNAFRLQDGTEGVGKVLISDANGNASWTASSSGTGTITGSGISNYIPRFGSSTGLTISNIYQGTASGTILIGYTSSSSTYDSDTSVLRVKGDVYFDNATPTKKFYLNGTYLFDDVKGSIALGYQALSGTAGNNNLAIGYQSLYNADGTTDYSLGIGYQSLFYNTGDNNLAIGYLSMRSNTTGDPNLAIGANSLYNNTTGINHIAIGKNALKGLTSGNHNISIGVDSFLFTGQGTHNVSVGNANFAYMITGSDNTAFGNNVMNNASYSNDNLAIGKRALYGATGASSSYNISIGNYSMYNNDTGKYNLAIGYNSLFSGTNSTFNLSIGYEALYNNTSLNGQNTAIGYRSMYSNTSGYYNLSIGHQSTYNNKSGFGNIAIGHNSLFTATNSNYNISIGYQSLYYNVGIYNIAMGYNSLFSNVGGSYNIGIGYQVMLNATQSSNNIGIGQETLKSLSTGSSNIAVGYNSGGGFNNGSNNIFISSNTSNIGLTSGSNNTLVGNSITFTSNSVSSFNTIIGASISVPLGVSNSVIIGNGQGVRVFYTYDYSFAIGYQALSNDTVLNAYNTAIGYQAGYALNTNISSSYVGVTSSQHNIAIGYRALYTATASRYNVAIGNNALYSQSIAGGIINAYNVAIGFNSMYANTSGYRNIAIGAATLQSNTTGVGSVAIGLSSLTNNTVSNFNIGIGYQTLYSSTNLSSNNIAVGYNAMANGTKGVYNIAFGVYAMANNNGDNNIVFGDNSLTSATSSYRNIAMGLDTLRFLNSDNQGGGDNIAIGHYSMRGTTASTYLPGYTQNNYPSYNIGIGANTLQYNMSSTASNTNGYNIAIGPGSQQNNVFGFRNISLGYQSLYGSFSSYNIAIGYQSMYSLGTTYDPTLSSYNIAIGDKSLFTSTQSIYNVAIGYQSMFYNTSGQRNVSIGLSSLFKNTTAVDVVAVGYSALTQNTTGSYNVGIGSRVLEQNTTGQRNTAFGYYSMRNNNIGISNLAIGHSSLYNGLSNSNVALGHESLYNVRNGAFNVAVGSDTGYNLGIDSTSDVYNTFVGARAAYGLSAGSYNTFIGSADSTKPGFTNGNYNTWVGSHIIGNSSSNTHNTVIGANVTIASGITNSIIIANGSGQQRIIVNATGSVIIPDLATSSTPRPIYALSDGRLTDSSYTNVRLLDSFSGSSFSDKLIDAGLNASGGTIIDCTAYSGNQTLNGTVFIRSSVKFVFGSINITFGSTNSNAHMFWINSDGVGILGNSRSTRSSQLLPTATTFTMTTTGATQAGYHIYNGLTYSGTASYNVINLKGFDCIGTASVYTGAAGGSGGTVSYSSYGVGGICIVEGDTFATGGGINVNQVVIEDILVDGSRDHGVLIIGAILAQVRNTRVSSAGGHGFYIGGGAVGSPAGLNAGGSTSTILLNCYASSGRLAGFALDGASYCQLQNCASEYFGMGYFFRSCFNVSVFGCGAESNQTQANIPKNLGIKFTNSSATASTLDDVGSDYVTRYTGTSYFISGGRNIYMPNPYSKDPGNNPGSGTASSATTAHITVYGSARSVYIPNPRTTGDSPTMYAIRVETDNTNAPRDVNILYNPADDRPTYSAPWTVYNSIPNISYNEVSTPRNPTAVILDQGSNTEIKNGTTFYSNTMLIGTASGNGTASAILQLDSTSQGFLVPRMTTAQVLAISNPSDGLTVYNTTLQTLCFYRGVAATWSAASYISM